MNHPTDNHDERLVEVFDTEEDAIRADRSKKAVAIGVVVSFVILLLAGTATAAWFGWSQYLIATADYEENFIAPLAVSADRWGNVRDALQSPQVSVDPATVSSIRKLITEIYDDQRNENKREMYRHIDKDGFIEQVVRSKQCILDRRLKHEIKVNFDTVTEGPRWYSNFEIVSIQELRKSPSDELLVYLHAWDEGFNEASETFRMWVKQTNRRWKVTDWESINEGISAATEYACLMGAFDNGSTQQNYYTFCDKCYEVEFAATQGDYKNATEKLKLVPLNLPVPLKPSAHFRLGNAYFMVDEYDEAIRAYQREKKPALSPGILYQLARCHLALQRNQKALAYIDKYLKIVGFTPSAIGLKSEILSELGRNDDAVDQLRDLANHFPQDHTVVRHLRNVMTTDNAEDVLEIAKTIPAAESFLANTIKRLYGIQDRPLANKLLEITRREGDAVKSLEAEASIASSISDFPTACACLLKALDAAKTKEEKLRLQNRYVDLMDTMDQAKVALARVPFPIDAMESFSDAQFDGDMSTSNEVMEDLASDFQAEHPNLASANFIYGASLTANAKFEEALPFLRSAIDAEQPTDDSVYSERANAYLRNALVNLGEFEQAFQVEEATPSNWSLISDTLAEDDTEGHQKLLKLYEKAVAKNNALKLEDSLIRSRAIIQWAAGQRHEALSMLFRNAIFDTEDDYSPARGLLTSLLAKVGSEEIDKVVNDWKVQTLFDQMTKDQRAKLSSILTGALSQSSRYRNAPLTGALARFQSLAAEKPSTVAYWTAELALATHDDQLLERSIKELDVEDLEEDSFLGYRGSDFFRRAALQLIATQKQRTAKIFISRVENSTDLEADEIVKLALAMVTDNASETIKILNQMNDSEYGMDFDALLNHPATSKFFTEDRYKKFRIKNSPSVTYFETEEIHFLFEEQPNIEAIIEEIRTLVPLLNFVEVKDEVNNARATRQKIAWLNGDVASLCLRKGTFTDSYDYQKKESIPTHQWVLTVGSRQFSHRDQVSQLHSPALALLLADSANNADSQCVAAYVDSHNLLISDFQKWAKTQYESVPHFTRPDKSRYLRFETPNEKSPWWKTRYEASQALIEILEDRSQAEDYEIQVSFSNGSLEESHWFPLLKVATNDSRVEIVFQRSKKIRLLPMLQKEEPQQVSLYQIKGIRKKQLESQ